MSAFGLIIFFCFILVVISVLTFIVLGVVWLVSR